MKKKMRQVTDNIHGTIYLSSLESELISTPYFYRLHDIYQSSTVYMTFPSNRTKRYEHSLGTMELASSILFSSISNSEKKTKNILFKNLKNIFKEILHLVIFQSEDQTIPYFNKNSDIIDELFDVMNYNYNNENENIKKIVDDIKTSLSDGCFTDSALDNHQYYPTDITPDNDEKLYLFLYRCLLQSIRIVALFHDVGHPPYSHIIEDVLKKMYEKCTNNNDFIKKCDNNKLNSFINILKPYVTKNKNQACKSNMVYTKSSSTDAALHERIGFNLLQLSLNDVISDLIKDTIINGNNDSHKIANVVYYIMIAELTIAILVEKNNLFKSFHKIVDGVLDADRLDYIMRDSLNSGVDWGKIPYKRLINSAKIVILDDNKTPKNSDVPFFIAYPTKLTDDIEDLLLTRYKIFARINFHHRCMKTANSLQESVQYLAENYLMNSEDEKCINHEISTLWNVLVKSLGNKKMRIIQWNDSWLISILHKSLINLSISRSTKHNILKENLEEILLNKKRYYSLFKRRNDVEMFVNKIFKHTGLTNDNLLNLKNKELMKYLSEINKEENDSSEDILKKSMYDAKDSINRINTLFDVIQSCDVETICQIIPLCEDDVYELCLKSINKLKEDEIILDGSILINKNRNKTGIPLHKNEFDEIYLYDDNNETTTFDDKKTLFYQINKVKNSVPWLSIYYVPIKESEDFDKNIADKICEELAKEIATNMKSRFEELFGQI